MLFVYVMEEDRTRIQSEIQKFKEREIIWTNGLDKEIEKASNGMFFLSQRSVENPKFRNAISILLLKGLPICMLSLEEIEASPAFVSQINTVKHYCLSDMTEDGLIELVNELTGVSEKTMDYSWDEKTEFIMSVSLRLLRETNGEEIAIDKDSFLIGKKPECDYVISDNPAISAVHARLIKDVQNVYLADMNSTNGTYLNSERILAEDKRELRHGDRIQLANEYFTVSMKWSVAGSEGKKDAY